MSSQGGGWSGYRSALEMHRVAVRILFESEPPPGVRLPTVLARAADWSVVADLAAALFAIRRLLVTAEALQSVTGSSSFAIAGDRIVVTPRAALLLVEPDRDTFDAKPEGAAGARIDIAEIAIAGISLLAGRVVDAIEASDPQSPLLKEMRDATAIRADMAFAGALHEWLDRALGADPRSGFADFRAARTALDDLHPPKGSTCRPSRRMLQSFLNDLQLPDFANPKLAVLEIERGRDQRRAMAATRTRPSAPAATPSHHDDDGMWAAIDFSEAARPSAPPVGSPSPEPPPLTPSPFDYALDDSSPVEFEEYKPADIPGSFTLSEPEPEPELEPEAPSFMAPSSFDPAEPAPPEVVEFFAAPSETPTRSADTPSYESEPIAEPEPEPEPEAESVWGRQPYSEEAPSPKRATGEDPNSWIPIEARAPEDRPADEPMTTSWLPSEARQAIIDAAPPPLPSPPVADEPPAPPPLAREVADDKDWFKPVVQEAPPADDDKDWFKSPVQQAPQPADDDKDWFKKEEPAPVEDLDEEGEDEAAAAAPAEEWFPEPSRLHEEVLPSAHLPPQPMEPPEPSTEFRRVAPLREEADLSAPEPELDAGIAIVHGAGASIVEPTYTPPPPEPEEPVKPRRERRPIHIETPSAFSAMRTIVITAVIAGGAVAGGYWYTHRATPGTITFETKPMGLELLQDGTVKGKTPITLVLRPGTYDFALRRGKTTKPFKIEVKEAENLTQKVDFTALKPVGTLVINTDPPGAKITLDGKSRGVSPQTISDVPIGPHAVVLEGEQGTLRRQVNVDEQETTTMNEGIFPGFLKVDASFDIKVLENGRQIGTGDGQISMRSGRHEIELVNDSQGYREKRSVDINPGEIKRILAK